MKWPEIEPLIDATQNLKGRQIQIHSFLSGFATSLSFGFKVESALVAFSNVRLMLLGEQASFTLSLRDVSSFSIRDGEIEIIELFHQKTERITRITITD